MKIIIKSLLKDPSCIIALIGILVNIILVIVGSMFFKQDKNEIIKAKEFTTI